MRKGGGNYWNDYRCQRKAARQRGIPFLLSFEQWFSIWKKSKRLPMRGVGKGKFVMARFGDQGAYESRNVRIISSNNNRREGHFEKMSVAHRQAIWKGYRKKFPEKKTKACCCGCGDLAKPGKNFIHGHAGKITFRKIAVERIGGPRQW